MLSRNNKIVKITVIMLSPNWGPVNRRYIFYRTMRTPYPGFDPSVYIQHTTVDQHWLQVNNGCVFLCSVSLSTLNLHISFRNKLCPDNSWQDNGKTLQLPRNIAFEFCVNGLSLHLNILKEILKYLPHLDLIRKVTSLM